MFNRYYQIMNIIHKMKNIKNLSFSIPDESHRTLKVKSTLKGADFNKYLQAILIDKANQIDAGKVCDINIDQVRGKMNDN